MYYFNSDFHCNNLYQTVKDFKTISFVYSSPFDYISFIGLTPGWGIFHMKLNSVAEGKQIMILSSPRSFLPLDLRLGLCQKVKNFLSKIHQKS